MESIPNDPKEVASAALQYEAEGHRILADAARMATDPLSKSTFDFLAAQELKHMQAIRDFVASLSGKGEFDPAELGDPITLVEAGEEIKGIFSQFESRFEEAAGEDAARMETYRVAMDMERHGHDFYKSTAERATDEASRGLYRFLAAEEIRHFEIIQDTRDFLEQPDAFLAIEERWMTT